MKTTENISLAGYAFTVEADAYEELKGYLNEIREVFKDDANVDEIASDIEERIAELLREINPELICVVAYGKILPENVIKYPKYGCINLHGLDEVGLTREKLIKKLSASGKTPADVYLMMISDNGEERIIYKKETI